MYPSAVGQAMDHPKMLDSKRPQGQSRSACLTHQATGESRPYQPSKLPRECLRMGGLLVWETHLKDHISRGELTSASRGASAQPSQLLSGKAGATARGRSQQKEHCT